MKDYLNTDLIFLLGHFQTYSTVERYDFDWVSHDNHFKRKLPYNLEFCLRIWLIDELAFNVEQFDNKKWDFNLYKNHIINIWDSIYEKVINKYADKLWIDFFLSYDLKVNLEKVNNFINEYYKSWFSWDLINYKWNYLKPKKQLNLFSSLLKEKVDDYGNDYLVFNVKDNIIDWKEVDILEIIFYLYYQKIIYIEKIFLEESLEITISLKKNSIDKITKLSYWKYFSFPNDAKWEDIRFCMLKKLSSTNFDIYFRDNKIFNLSWVDLKFFKEDWSKWSNYDILLSLLNGLSLSPKSDSDKKRISNFKKTLISYINIKWKPFNTKGGCYNPNFNIFSKDSDALTRKNIYNLDSNFDYWNNTKY